MEILNRSSFAKNLIAIRKQRGISQRDLAKKTGLSHRVIAYYETRVEIPSIDKIETIANVLEIPVSKLIDSSLSDKDVLTIDTRTLKKIRLWEQLPKDDQKKVMIYIRDLIRKNEVVEG